MMRPRSRPPAPAVGLTRRGLVAGIAALPLLGAVTWTGRRIVELGRSHRPRVSGTSRDRCALCGDPGHAMLDARCPAGPEVLA